MDGANRIRGYAKGLFEIARAEGELERVESELAAIARAVEGSDELQDTLADQLVPTERKQAIIHDLIGGRASRVTVAAVDMVVAAGHGRDLSRIADALGAAAASSRSRDVAEVRTAVELDQDTVRRLESALSRATGRQVEVKVVVDPSVVGGIVARVGDTVIDGSVRSRLDSLRRALRAG